MGLLYGAINVGLFFIAAAAPLGESGARNALRSIMEVALILYKWHKSDPSGCRAFVEEAESLQSLYKAVRQLA
jgi:hypothetical protein